MINITNVFVCVTRNRDGGNIGPDRFKLIKKCTRDILQAFPFNRPIPNFNSLKMVEATQQPILELVTEDNTPPAAEAVEEQPNNETDTQSQHSSTSSQEDGTQEDA